MSENSGIGLGYFSASPSPEEVAAYERRKAQADLIEGAVMKACEELARRVERESKLMSTEELLRILTTMGGAATVLNSMRLYAAPPFGYGCA